eukprot:TRINITY_DN95976_c0_g1_i1.p1 TRINITY_DN95976_c0_g1~~TRINITY_DN95976_c0_g1_i1.p1  ORF type:complete len:330 (+),score=39.38 TRINITY_DN95976_c0_g1_i1:74-991(+)
MVIRIGWSVSQPKPRSSWATIANTQDRTAIDLFDEVIAPSLPGVSFRHVMVRDFQEECITFESTAAARLEAQPNFYPFTVGSGLGTRLDACWASMLPMRGYAVNMLEIETNSNRGYGVITAASNADKQVPADLEGLDVGFPTGDPPTLEHYDIFNQSWPNANLIWYSSGPSCLGAMLRGDIIGCIIPFNPSLGGTPLEGFLADQAACRERGGGCFPESQEPNLGHLAGVNFALRVGEGLIGVDDDKMEIIKEGWFAGMANGKYRTYCDKYAERKLRDCTGCSETLEVWRKVCLMECMIHTGKPCA